MPRKRPAHPRSALGPPAGALVVLLVLLVFLVGVATLSGCQPDQEDPPGWTLTQEAQREQSVVYGVDDRVDVFETGNLTFRQRAIQTTAALMFASDLDTSNPNNVIPLGETLAEYLGLCPNERFGNQPTSGFCSGTLIDDDLFLTAGHCIDTQGRCNQSRIVFDYLYPNTPGNLGPISLTEDVYFCAEILITEQNGDADFAVIRLDRPATGKVPTAIVRREDFDFGQPITLIGYPTGIPAKIAENGFVIDPGAPSDPAFTASIDAFGGNSGSGVFTPSGDQLGILVAGQQDYVFDFENGCTRVNVLPEGDPPGEVITYAAHAIDALCATGFDGELCGSVDPQAGETCANVIPLPAGVSSHIVAASLAGTANDYGGSCGGNGPEVVYSFEVEEASAVVIEASGFDTLVHVRTACESPATEVACDDDGGAGTNSRWEGFLQPGLHYLFMDAWGTNIQSGNYTLTINFDPMMCVDVCFPGSQQCTGNGNGLQVCEPGPEGCFVWSPPIPCGPGSMCQNGTCTGACMDECPGAGLSLCVNEGTFGQCGFFDGDPCLDAQVTFCGPEEVCIEQQGCTPCSFCDPGETRCSIDGALVEICEVGPSGCGTWFPLFPCEPGTACSAGECVEACFDECFPGDDFCAGVNVAFSCEDIDQDPCFDLVEEVCGPGELCEDGSCQPVGCENECTIPSSVCSGPDVRACVVGPDGCTELGPPTPCASGGICDPATGLCPEGCQDVCTLGAAACLSNDTYRVCLDEDEDGCPTWTAARFCFGDTVCRDGLCVLDEEPADAGPGPLDGGVYHFPTSRPPGRVKIAAPSLCASTDGDVTLPALFGALALSGLVRRRRR